MVYDFPAEEKRALGIRKRADQMERAMHYLRGVHAPHVFPIAGPPCFLDDDLFAFNDLDDDPDEHLPGPERLPRRDGSAPGSPAGELLVPGSVATLARR